MLPFYNKLRLQPMLPIPVPVASLSISIPKRLGYIRKYVEDIPYFMTLGTSVGSVLWSIFWEPGLECNLVSAWFGSILEVIKPIITARNTDMLAKVFTFRRERVGLLWRALFGLGNPEILDMIVSYLESHEERQGGSSASPDIDVAVWTGSPQSSLDEDFSDIYRERTAQVSRSDLLRHRFNFRFGDPEYIRSGWQPFGYVPKEQIESELWPGLESGRPRRYKHWIWWVKDDDGRMVAEVQQGFRSEKVGGVSTVSKEPLSQISQVKIPSDFSCNVRLAPSFEATWSTLHHGAKEASGDRSLESTLIEGIREHPWFAESPV